MRSNIGTVRPRKLASEIQTLDSEIQELASETQELVSEIQLLDSEIQESGGGHRAVVQRKPA